MGVTTAQLQTIGKFTFGAQTHHVQSVSESVEAVRETPDGDVTARRHTVTVRSYLDGSSVADLKSKRDALITQIEASDADFTLERFGAQVQQIQASDASEGPTASVDFDETLAVGFLQSFTFTVSALIPISGGGGGGVLSHEYTETTTTDDDDDVIRSVRSGTVITETGTSAKDEAESLLPSQPAGYIREIQITTNDDDTKATYTVTDSESSYRNVVAGVVKTHEYTDTTVTEVSTVTRKERSGKVITVTGTNAQTWINANLPPLADGMRRTVSIRMLDTTLEADYTVSDELVIPSGGTLPPGIDEARLDARIEKDEQFGEVLVTDGYFIGANAQTEVDAIRDALSNLVRQSERVNTYGDGRIEFSFTSLRAQLDDDFLSWQESITVTGGGRTREARMFADRDPFIFNGAKQPYVVSVAGRAEGIGKYVAPPGLITAIALFIHGEPEVNLMRDHDNRFVTTWRQRYLTATSPGTLKPRDPIVAFLP